MSIRIEIVVLSRYQAICMLKEPRGIVELVWQQGEPFVEVIYRRFEPVELNGVFVERPGHRGTDDVDRAGYREDVIGQVKRICRAVFVKQIIVRSVIGHKEKLPVDTGDGGFIDDVIAPPTDALSHVWKESATNLPVFLCIKKVNKKGGLSTTLPTINGGDR